MTREKVAKTNAMRMLDQAKIEYRKSHYPIEDNQLDGVSVARKLGVEPEVVYKTLVLKSDQGHHVAVIPSDHELNLKLAAKSFRVKRVEMLPVKELLPLTGYVKGGCSPLGMKKVFPTLVDQSARELDHIYISAGKIGVQIVMDPKELVLILRADFAPLSQKE